MTNALKNPPVGISAVPDYFNEMLERIRDIRASERSVYLRVTEIFTMTEDYSHPIETRRVSSKSFKTNCTTPALI